MRTLTYLPHYTYSEYCTWEGQWELIDGIPVAIRPTAEIQQQWLLGKLISIFIPVLKASCDEWVAYHQIDWLIKDDTVVRPDLLITRNLDTKEYLDFPPVLIIEILSPSTAIKDRNAKYQIYESQKVNYYLIVDVTAEKIEVYELIDGQYQPAAVNPGTFEFNLHNNCSVHVSFDQLWY